MGIMIMEKIASCHNCGIRKYQPPLLDDVPIADKVIMCVDFAAPKLPVGITPEKNPLRCFPTKEILSQPIKDMQKIGYAFYHTYLLKCTPILNGAPRKPFKHELQTCFFHLQEEIKALQPKAVLLFGQNTYLPVLSMLGIPLQKWNGVYFNIHKFNGINYIPISSPLMGDIKHQNNYALYGEGINNVLLRCIEH